MNSDLLKILQLKEINAGASSGKANSLLSSNTKIISSINPANNKTIASVQTCSHEDYQKIVQTAHQTFLKWREVPAPKRGELVRQIGALIREKKTALAQLVSLESGKSKAEGEGEVQEMIDMADFAVGQSRMLYGKSMHSERPQHRMYEQWHPLGVVGVISAFNFPVAVWAWNAFLAAIAGDTIIWKPSPKTPLCALAVQQLCNEVMAHHGYDGIFSTFITDETDLAHTFVNDSYIPLISFTGSTTVGLKVYETCAKRMARCLLECSGNNAVIVDETADLNLAIPAILFGAIGTAGQRCTSIRRLFVHESLFENLVKKLQHAYQKISVGDPLNDKNLMGPLIDQSAVTAFQNTIATIKKLDGEIIYGGNVLKKTGCYVEPTVVRAKPEWPIVGQETFAPILYVMSFKNIEQAIFYNNNVCQGLASAIFSNHFKNIEYFLSAQGSDCGIANVNMSTSGAEIGGAFGGEKATGGGREAGSDSWKAYMRRQTVNINWSDAMPLAQGIQFKLD
jgi:aldehyde dehydrogenase (NAD+)